MGQDIGEAQKAGGLQTAIDTVVAPKEAFARIAVAPTWGWALLIVIVLMVAGYFMQRPAALHAGVGTTEHMVAASPLYANATDETKQRAIEAAKNPAPWQTIAGVVAAVIVLLIVALLNAVMLLIGSAIGKGSANFARAWAASINIAIPTLGLSGIVLGIICILRGPDAFATTIDLMAATPGLGLLAHNASPAVAGFLTGISVFSLWGCWLNATFLRSAGVNRAVAWIVPVIILLFSGAFAALGGAFAG